MAVWAGLVVLICLAKVGRTETVPTIAWRMAFNAQLRFSFGRHRGFWGCGGLALVGIVPEGTVEVLVPGRFRDPLG